MASLRIFARRAALAAGIAAILLALALSLEGPRSVVGRVALGIFLGLHGMHVAGGDITWGADRVSATDLQIDDAHGHALSIQRLRIDYDWRGLFGRSDRRYGIRAIQIVRPTLRIFVLPDGSTNLSSFAPRAAPVPMPTPVPSGVKPVQPLQLTLHVQDGQLDIANPSAYARPGRAFSVTRIQVDAKAYGGRASGRISARYSAEGSTSLISGAVSEDDEVGFADARFVAPGASLAPPLDAFVSTPLFVVERGIADVIVRAYDAGYAPSSGPVWHVSARAQVLDGQMRVVPLAVPIRDMRGALTLSAGYLGFDALTGTAAGMPVAARGSIRLDDGVRFAFAARTHGDLRDGKRLLTFANAQVLDGGFDARLRVDGPLHDVHVAGLVAATGDERIAGVPTRGARASFYYQNNHVTLPFVEAAYDGGQVEGGGDIALRQPEPEFQAIVSAALPAANVPLVTNLNRGGRFQALLSIDGPPSSARYELFGRTYRGRGATAKLDVLGTFSSAAAGALLVAWPRGDITVRTAYDRSQPGTRALLLSLIASHAPVRLFGGGASLPGITQFIALPDAAGDFDGVALVRGSLPDYALQTAVAVRGRNVLVGNERVDDVAIRAHGAGTRIALDSLALQGRDVSLRASGVAAIDPDSLSTATELRGDAAVDLGRFDQIAGVSLSGRLRGDFEVASSRSGWAAAIATRAGDAAIDGIPLRGVLLNATAGQHQPLRFALDGSALGGTIAALGSTSAANIFASGIDVTALRPNGLPLDAGTAVVIGRVATGKNGPDLAAVVSVVDGRFRGTPLAASGDVAYAGHVLHGFGDVDLAGTRVHVLGTARGVSPGASLSGVALEGTAAVREGDLAIVGPYLPPALPVTGGFDANVAIHGSAGSPQLDGTVNSQAATLRGVTLLRNAGTFAYGGGGIMVRNGSTQLGDTNLAFGGSYAARETTLHASSPHLDLSDANDFFQGRDVLDGRGSASFAVTLRPHTAYAGGHVALTDTQVAGIPLGFVDASLRGSGADALHVDIAQHGELGASSFAGDLTFHDHTASMPDGRHATYSLGGRATDIDLGLVARLTGLEDAGLRGMLDANGTVRGSFSRPAVDVAFNVHDGYLRRIQLRAASGRIASDGSRVMLRQAYVEVPFGHASANGTLTPSGALSGGVQISIADLNGLATLLGRAGDVTGSAQGDLLIGGTTHRPVLHGSVSAPPGTLFGVAYDELAAHATYAKNELTIGDTTLRLAHKRGTLTLAGTLPLELVPFELGPPQRLVDLRVQASSIDMAAFDPLLTQFGTLGGTLDANASLSGTAGKPSVAGSVRLRGGTIASRYQAVPLQSISADLTLSRDAITLSNVSGKAGKGTFAGSGAAYIVPAVGLRHAPGLAYYATLQARDFPLDVPSWVSGVVNGEVGLSKSGSTPLLYGNVLLRDGTIPVSAIVRLATMLGDTAGPPSAANIPGVPAIKPGHIIAYGGGVYAPGTHLITPAALATPAPTIFDLPSLNLQLAAKTTNVRVRGGPVDLTTNGDLAVDGSVRDPQLAGEFNARRGTLSAYGVTFHVERGVLAFSPDQGVLPSLDARASTTINGDRITLDVSGRVDRLNTVLSSSQGKTPEEILASIVTGSDVGALTGAASGQSVALGAQRLLGTELTRGILAPFSSALAQSLSVEEVSFSFNTQGQIVVEVRKFVTPTIALLYGSTTTGPSQQYWGTSYYVRDYAAVDFTSTTAPTGFVSYQFRIRVTFK